MLLGSPCRKGHAILLQLTGRQASPTSSVAGSSRGYRRDRDHAEKMHLLLCAGTGHAKGSSGVVHLPVHGRIVALPRKAAVGGLHEGRPRCTGHELQLRANWPRVAMETIAVPSIAGPTWPTLLALHSVTTPVAPSISAAMLPVLPLPRAPAAPGAVAATTPVRGPSSLVRAHSVRICRQCVRATAGGKSPLPSCWTCPGSHQIHSSTGLAPTRAVQASSCAGRAVLRLASRPGRHGIVLPELAIAVTAALMCDRPASAPPPAVVGHGSHWAEALTVALQAVAWDGLQLQLQQECTDWLPPHE